jgi:energy-coupling factor transporter ATP-binding protein EcfA2
MAGFWVMDTSILQQKLADFRHLLPSQQELLNRLLFQLAFNDFQNIGLVGTKGGGKSTIALALAELFSEQANVAMLTAPLEQHEIEALLLQHWYGQLSKDPSLAELIANPLIDEQPKLLIVDNFDLLDRISQQKLLQLNCLGFFLLSAASTDMALNLSINVPTLQDASQVLNNKTRDPLAIAERFAASAGNMHLLHEDIVLSDERKARSIALWILPLVLILLFTAFISGLLSSDDEQVLPVPNATPKVVQKSLEPASRPELDPLSSLDSINSLEPLNSLKPESLDSPEPVKSPEREPFDSPEPKSIPEHAREIALTAKPAQINSSALNNSTNEIVTTTPVIVSESASLLTPSDTPSPESNSIIELPAVEFRYQEQHLLALSAESRVLQLAVLSSEVALKRFIQAYPATAIMVYQRSWQGQLQWIILADAHYSDLSSARQARTLLAESLSAIGPFIKPVGQVQQEIKALARLRAESERQEE